MASKKPHGYWKEWRNVEQELRNFIEKNGKFPSQKYLCSQGNSALAAAIHIYHGGFPACRKRMGFNLAKNPNGYWDEESNLINEAKIVLEKYNLKRLPSHSNLVKLGYSALASGIQNYPGGYTSFRETLGEEKLFRGHGVWKNLDYVLEQANQVMEELEVDTLPSQGKLTKLGYGMIGCAASQYHGGLTNLRKILGEELKARESGTWKNLDYTIKEAKGVMRKHKLKVLPSANKLNKMGYGALVKGITSHHGGFREFREKLGQKQIATKAGTWQDLDYTIKQAKLAMEEMKVNSLPCNNILVKRGYGPLASAITKNHGGMKKFRSILGDSQKRTNSELLKDFNYVKNMALDLMQKNGWDTLPSSDTLRSIGEGWLVSSINHYHGGIYKFRERIGQKPIQKALNYWKDIDNVFNEILKVMRDLGYEELPSSRILQHNGYSTIYGAVGKYHGGFRSFRGYFDDRFNKLSEENNLENFLENYVGGKNGK